MLFPIATLNRKTAGGRGRGRGRGETLRSCSCQRCCFRSTKSRGTQWKICHKLITFCNLKMNAVGPAVCVCLCCRCACMCLPVCACVSVHHVCYSCYMYVRCRCWHCWWLCWGYVTLSSSPESGSLTSSSDICSSSCSAQPTILHSHTHSFTHMHIWHTLRVVCALHFSLCVCVSVYVLQAAAPAAATTPWQMAEHFQRWRTQRSAKLF